jgi:nitroreductase
MDFWEVVVRRRSVRKFEHEDVPEKAVEDIIKAASLAPSGSNAKNWHFVIVRDAGTKAKMRGAVDTKINELVSKMKSQKARDEFLSYCVYFTFFSEAPVVIAVVMRKYDSLSARIIEKYSEGKVSPSAAGIQNVAAAIENMLLAATAMGLGGCWMTGPMIAKEGLEEILGIKEPDNLIALVPVGVPKDVPPPHEFPEELEDVMTVI